MKYSVYHHHIGEAAREAGRTMDEMLAEIRSWGIRYVELDRDAVGPNDEAIRALSAQLTRCGLAPSSIYCFYNWQEEGNVPAESDLLLRQAEMMHCPRVMIIPGFYTDVTDAEKCRAEKARMISGMQHLCRMAAQRGLIPTIECFDDARSPIATIAGMAEFLDAVPELMVTLETGNFLFSGDNILEAQQRFAGRIAHVHLKDRFLPRLSPEVAPRGERTIAATGEVMYPCAVGSGHIPMQAVLAGLKQADYDGILTIEHFGAANWAETIRASITWLLAKEAEL